MDLVRRMLDESIKHCSTRIVGGKPLISLDQIRYQIDRIQSAFTICSAMCTRNSVISGIENNLASAAIETNSMKAYITDLIQEAAQTLTQLSGANSFRSDLISDSMETIKHEISMIVSSYKFQTSVSPTEEYKDQSSWLAFC